jgi:signal transduction histidine kinase
VPVRHGGEVLAVLRLQERENDPLTPVEERLVSGLAAQAGLVLRSARLRAELSQRFAELSVRAEELRASRERLITTQDAERRALERDIHDGAQQNLVALAVNLRLADALRDRSPQRAIQVMTEQSAAARQAIDTLLRLSRGIYPHLLESDGLVAAITAAAVASSLPVDVIAEDVPRPARPIEAALYFCCLEALQNAAKHSGARRVTVHIDAPEEGSLRLVVRDDGCGFDTAHGPRGVGMANMRDRVDAAGGLLSVDSTPGQGTVVTVRVPSGVVAMGVG